MKFESKDVAVRARGVLDNSVVGYLSKVVGESKLVAHFFVVRSSSDTADR